MNEAGLRELVKKWELFDADEDGGSVGRYAEILDQLDWFGAREWANYLPAQHPQHAARYLGRLAEWVGNVESDEDRKLLLEYALHISFYSHDDLCALYRSAFTGAITRWVIQHEALSLDVTDFQARLDDELYRRTWYCPVTDSMNINEFYHANHITGVSHRPGFSAVAELDKRARVVANAPSEVVVGMRKFIADPNSHKSAPPFKRLVLLEDFVGSGTQASRAVKWAAKHLDLPILFVPLVICAPGVTELAKIVAKLPTDICISPQLVIGERDLLGPNRNGADSVVKAAEIERLARDTFEQIAGGPHTDVNAAPYTPFGFRETGSSFVSYSNTPNNTLPMIHHSSRTWRPLFPRSARI